MPIRKSAAAIPPPPPVNQSASSSHATNVTKVKKGQGPTQKELQKKQRDELMKRIQAARNAAAAKMRGGIKSPWKITVS